MGEFFLGWRRKVGIATLVLASVFTGGWVRSQVKLDEVLFPNGDAAYGLVSAAGSIDFFRMKHSGAQWEFFWTSEDLALGGWIDRSGSLYPWTDSHQIVWRFDWGGFRVGVSRLTGRQDTDCVLPYWSIDIPLILLSAYLLLMKPSREKQTKAVDLIPVDGA